ncbi:hypothetical protein STA3757_03980 [Stanieria sp. NIES-3757]|nr:hypothetical protein STA3757_03980 [Stanieria sp. NIES-3757]
MSKRYRAKKYSELSDELQRETLVNSMSLRIAVEQLSLVMGLPVKEIAEKLSIAVNVQISSMSDQEVKKVIEDLDNQKTFNNVIIFQNYSK